MEAVLIDQFVVPEAAVEEFLRQVHFSANIVKNRPGFVEGYIYRRATGDGQINVVTTAVWASQAAMEDAKTAIPAEFAKVGFSPPEVMKRLGVQIMRGLYERTAY
jgi:heme-degrading monooxygenase HmoA